MFTREAFERQRAAVRQVERRDGRERHSDALMGLRIGSHEMEGLQTSSRGGRVFRPGAPNSRIPGSPGWT